MPTQRRSSWLSIPQVVLLGALWFLLSGHTEWFILALGLLSILGVAGLASRMGLADGEGLPLHLMPRALSYWGWLLVQIVRANLDVARRVIDPDLPIDPVERLVPAGQASELGKVTYANSITLTPGTVAVRVDEHGILVHGLTREGVDELLQGEMDRRVVAVERAR